METISVSKLKAHLSEEIRKRQSLGPLIILDHKRPVATLSAIDEEPFLVKEAGATYQPKKLAPLVVTDPVLELNLERGDF